LAKLIAIALPKNVAMKLANHPGFAASVFDEPCRRKIAGSFGDASSGGAA
jgi:hypothetical protein